MNKKNKYYFVAGCPINHSLSPIFFEKYNNNSSNYYTKALCQSAADVEVLLENGFSGGNITAPLKESILKLNYYKSQNVEKIQAANTIYLKEDNFCFENTDILGVKNSLKEHLTYIKSKKVLVMGVGGAGRAAAYSLIEEGFEVTITNRTIEKAQHWSEVLKCNYICFSDLQKKINNYIIIINTLPNEAYEKINLSFNQSQIILDADYKNKPLKEIATKCKSKYIDGTEWLKNQAKPAFSLFANTKAEERNTSIKEENANTQNNTNILLIGMMKSGKSTTAKQLSKITNMQYVDTDKLIEKRVGKSISEIFISHGEKFFRDLETEILKEILKNSNQVIATGGGIVLSAENKLMIKSTLSIWLFTNPKKLYNRGNNLKRPLLKDSINENNFCEIFYNRFNDYIKSTRIILPTQNYKMNDIALIIKNKILN